VKKMNERLLIVVNYCFSNAPSNLRKLRALFVTYFLEQHIVVWGLQQHTWLAFCEIMYPKLRQV
jgi:hypothetical protein